MNCSQRCARRAKVIAVKFVTLVGVRKLRLSAVVVDVRVCINAGGVVCAVVKRRDTGSIARLVYANQARVSGWIR